MDSGFKFKEVKNVNFESLNYGVNIKSAKLSQVTLATTSPKVFGKSCDILIFHNDESVVDISVSFYWFFQKQ